MQHPVSIVFDDVDSSPAVEQRIRERVRRLERCFAGVTGCHVALSAPHRPPRKGGLGTVRIAVRVPGTELVSLRRPGDGEAHDDLLVAIGDSFDAIERELEAWDAVARGAVTTRVAPPQARRRELDRKSRGGPVGRIRTAASVPAPQR
jgi:ribosome-associated translation inhibitor RaiA